MSRLSRRLSRICRIAVSAIFPPKCAVCGAVTGSETDGCLCDSCNSAFAKEFVTVCPSCGNAPSSCICVPDICGSEYDRSPFTAIMPLTFIGYYTGYAEGSVVAALVYKMKRKQTAEARLFFARILAEAVARSLLAMGERCAEYTVTFIPRSRSAFAEYGFDHMEAISRRVAEMLGCRYASLLLRDGGSAQKELSAEERTANAYKSISANAAKGVDIRCAKIILLDDVITTGATMRAAIGCLSFAGASVILPASLMISKTRKKRTRDPAVGSDRHGKSARG